MTGVTIALLFLGPQIQDRVIRHASTNLHNLSHGRIATLFDSAFVVDAGPIYLWLPGLMCLMALAELQWGSCRLVVAFAVGHVGATLLVALGLTAGLSQYLAKVSLDSTIQTDVPARSHSSAFARGDTTLQLAWVIGGFVGIAMPWIPQLGLGTAAVILTAWAVYVLGSRPRKQTTPVPAPAARA